MEKGWIAVDLDGTLAKYDEWRGPEHIGDPIWPMVDRVKAWIAEGKDVRIFTARVCFLNDYAQKDKFLESFHAYGAINNWCALYLGCVIPITCVKDFGMIELWDDRAIRVEKNTGKIL